MQDSVESEALYRTHWTAPGVTKISTKETASRNKIIKKIEAETSKKSDPLVIIIREANIDIYN